MLGKIRVDYQNKFSLIYYVDRKYFEFSQHTLSTGGKSGENCIVYKFF